MKPKRRSSQTATTPAPIGGLNARDALAAMPPQDAVTMDNFFPTPTTVDLRNGRVEHVTGIAAHVESLMAYNSAATSKLFAAAGTAFYDVTTTGTVGAAVVTGQTNARWQHANIGTTGGQFLYCVNGVDDPQLYNGTAWQAVSAASAPIAITGVTTNLLISVNEYKTRLFFVEKNSFRVWYLPVNSVGGAAAQLDFSSLFKLGGYLMAMCTWTIDNAGGINEYAVFISSEGEVIFYNGTDPASAGNWVKQGSFRMGRPIGRRCYTKVGADIILISADGFFPLSKALLTDRSQQQGALSSKIINLVNSDVKNYAANFGWEICLYPIGNKLIINVPQIENSIQYQYVMNTVTGAWCRFVAWNANCFAVMGDSLYFGGNLGALANSATVSMADTGNSDVGTYIFGELKAAFQYFGSPGNNKHIKMVKPTFETNGVVKAAISIDVNFSDRRPSGTLSFSGGAGTPWSSAPWNSFQWADYSSIKNDWQGASGIGHSIAFHILIVNNASPLKLYSIDYLYETGGVL